MLSSKVFSSLRKTSPSSLTSVLKYSSDSDQIVIPKRIPRGPTDILKALSSTVKKDPTAPHYKFHDDPYLIPYSNVTKRSYALSMEAGRKAAYWVRQEHADLFQHKVADPPIEAFVPKPVYDVNSEVSEEDLKKVIGSFRVSDAITVYGILEKSGAEISRETQQSLLELLCFYNCEDPLSEDWIEERWFRSGVRNKDAPKKTWQETGLAWELFNKMKPRDAKSYSAIITGMCHYGMVTTAYKLYEECMESGVVLSVSAYNALLARLNFLRESHALMWDLGQDLLKTMRQNRVSPNLGTLNGLLESLSLMTTSKYSRKNALSIIAEFRHLGIKPSLASCFHLLNVFSKDTEGLKGILHDVLDYLESENLSVRDPKDNGFFVRAMDLCRNQLRDPALAKRIDTLLRTGTNYNFIGDSFKETTYYRHFLALLCETEPLDELMKTYQTLVPNIYTPEPIVLELLLNSIELSGEFEFVPKVWQDIISFEQTDRERLLSKILSIMASNFDESLIPKFSEIGWEIWEKIENLKRERTSLTWTAKMLSDLLMVQQKSGDQMKMDKVFDKLVKGQGTILGEPEVLSMQLYLDSCIASSSTNMALKCIRYCHDIGFLEVDDMARKLDKEASLSESERKELIDIVGEETLSKV